MNNPLPNLHRLCNAQTEFESTHPHQSTDMNKFQEWLAETWGLEYIPKNNFIDCDWEFNILDEAKYTFFLLRYSDTWKKVHE
jgi:hypothetical protein